MVQVGEEYGALGGVADAEVCGYLCLHHTLCPHLHEDPLK